MKSKLNAGNIVSANNARAVLLVRYGAGILKWNKEEMRAMDRKTRKLMTTYRTLHPQADVDRLYLKREDGGRGMIGIEDCVDMEIANLKEYVTKSEEKMLKAVVEEGLLTEGRRKNTILEKRKDDYLGKTLHREILQEDART